MTRSWVLGTVGRMVTFVLAELSVLLIVRWHSELHPGEGITSGEALATLAFFLAGATVWGGWDGVHSRSVLLVLGRWTAVGVVLLILQHQVVGVFELAGYVTAAALLSGAVCWIRTGHARRHPTPA